MNDEAVLSEMGEKFNYLYSNIDGALISREARRDLNLPNLSLTYGEMNFAAMKEILDNINALGGTAGKKFYDLGSGAGKAVILAALLGDFKKVAGIEILEPLHQAAEMARKKLILRLAQEATGKKIATIAFIRDNIFWADFSEADIVLASTTCFDDQMMDMLKWRLTMLRPSSLVATVSRSLHSGYYDVVKRCKINLKWGEATVYIHRKIY